MLCRVACVHFCDCGSELCKKVHKPTTLATSSPTTEQTEYAKLQAKAAALEKELTQLKCRAAAFDYSEDPYEDNVDLELFSYE
ncbi:hypothetical protein Dimus_027084 [Dionaea muscipula]